MTQFLENMQRAVETPWLGHLIVWGFVILVGGAGFWLLHVLLRKGLRFLVEQTALTFDNLNLRGAVFIVLPGLVPAVMLLSTPDMVAFLEGHPWASQLADLFGVVLLAWLSFLLVRRLLVEMLHHLVKQTEFTWDDIILQSGVFGRLAYLAPGGVISAFPDPIPLSHGLLSRLLGAYVAIVVTLAALSLLNACNTLYNQYVELAKSRPIKGYVQIVQIVVTVAGTIVGLAALADVSPLGFLSGLGALMAIIILLFRDTILSFVASIRIASNDMIRVGDWVEMPKFGADGTVIDIALHTITVQNGDKTITRVPTHKLIEDSFRNWRGIQSAGARRIKRSLRLDQASVCFCDEPMLAKFSKIHLLTDYITEAKKKLAASNDVNDIDMSESTNGRRLTNLGTFRIYMSQYLAHLPGINSDMTCLVRQLQAGAEGVPIEIYAFSKDPAWSAQEKLQADIFDHLLAVLPEFGLRVFQNPTGADFRTALSA